MFKLNIKVERIFAVLALIFGLIFVFKTAPFHGPNEAEHFLRVYQISHFQPIKTNTTDYEAIATLPKNMVEAVSFYGSPENLNANHPKSYLNFKIDKSEKIETNISVAAVYSPITYTTQSIGLGISSLFTKNVLTLSYLLRIFSLLTYIALVYLAIKKLKKMKWFMLFVALLPVCIAQASVLNEGAITFGLIFLFISYIISILTKDENITKKEWLILGILSVLLILANRAYTPLILLLLITYKKWNSTKQMAISIGSIFIAGIIALIAGNLLVGGAKAIAPGLTGDNYDMQLSLLQHSPIYFWQRFTNTFFSHLSWNWLPRTVGSQFDWDIPLKIATPIGALILITLPILAFLDGKAKINIKTRLIPILVVAINFFVIAIIYYLVHMQVGDRAISGIQGRYFTPFLLPLSLIFLNTKKIKYAEIIAPILSVSLSLIMLLALVI